MKPIGIAIIGFGKIAADQHVPSIEGNDRFKLLATSSRSSSGRGTQVHRLARTDPPDRGAGGGGDHYTARPALEIAAECIRAGLHVLLEKPPRRR